MKKIILLTFLIFILLSCTKANDSKIIYTTTEFNTIWENSWLNNHFDTKQASWSNVYEINFENRKKYSQKLIKSSEKKLVYHDFCKINNRLYVVWWEFWKVYWTAMFTRLYPELENSVLFKNSEIRIRDCEFIEQDWKEYIWMVTHGEWNLIILDWKDYSEIVKLNSPFIWEINWKTFSWTTMIHEIISSDLNWDSNNEFYYTVTSENWTTDIDQKWKIFKWFMEKWLWKNKELFDLWDSYSKEIHNIILKNNKNILLSSIQWKTKIKEDAEIKNNNKTTEIIRPTILKAIYEENWELESKDLWSIDVVQCRTVDTWNFYKDKNSVWIIVWCDSWLINIYTLDNNLNLELKNSLNIWNKQIHSFFVKDTNNDNIDEIFVWVDMDWVYHLDLQDEELLFKLFDYSKSETWIWAINEIK